MVPIVARDRCQVTGKVEVSATPRWFPIQWHGHSPHGERFRIPWSIAQKAYVVYEGQGGRGQSLERVAERGGFELLELIWLLAGAPENWPQRSDFHNRFPEEVTKAAP